MRKAKRFNSRKAITWSIFVVLIARFEKKHSRDYMELSLSSVIPLLLLFRDRSKEISFLQGNAVLALAASEHWRVTIFRSAFMTTLLGRLVSIFNSSIDT